MLTIHDSLGFPRLFLSVVAPIACSSDFIVNSCTVDQVAQSGRHCKVIQRPTWYRSLKPFEPQARWLSVLEGILLVLDQVLRTSASFSSSGDADRTEGPVSFDTTEQTRHPCL